MAHNCQIEKGRRKKQLPSSYEFIKISQDPQKGIEEET